MKIYLDQLSEEGVVLQGEISPEILSPSEFTPTSTIHYSMRASLQGTDVLVQGNLSVQGTIPCARCLYLLPLQIQVPDFTVLVEHPKGEFVDLTDAVREDILLALPAYNKCELDSESRCPITGENWKSLTDQKPWTNPSEQWAKLDKLKLN